MTDKKKLYPKCVAGKEMYIDSDNCVKPCCWVEGTQHQTRAKAFFKLSAFNIQKTPLNIIVEKNMKRWFDLIQQDPEKYAFSRCWRKCYKSYDNTSNVDTNIETFRYKNETE